jgi:transposase
VPLLDGVCVRRRGRRPRRRSRRVVGDKAYSERSLRRCARLRHIRLIAPERADQARWPGPHPVFDREAYRGRNIIERDVGWLKERRRIATRYEKLARNYLAMVELAMIEQALRLLDSSDRA